MSALAISRVELLRLLRDRTNLFFVFGLPLLLVILIGSQFGVGFDTRIGVVAGGDDRAVELVDAIDANEGIVTRDFDDADELRDAVARGEVSAGVTIPADYTDRLVAGQGATVGFLGRPDGTALSLRQVVDAAVTDQAALVTAAQVAAERTGMPSSELLDLAGTIRAGFPGIEVVREPVGGDPLAQEFAALGQFDLGASTQLFLFVFLTSMTSAVALIQARELGVTSRILSTPTPMALILLGSTGGRLLVALAQAAYIVVATVLLFQVNWGDPLAASVVVLLFCVVSAGASMLVGAALRNESQAIGVGIGLGIGMGALGGSMVPLEIFPEGMRAVAFLTPHAWANEAMAELVRRDGGLGDVLTEVAVLAAYAAALLALATWRLRVVLTR